MRIGGTSGNEDLVLRVANDPDSNLQCFHHVTSIKKAQISAPFRFVMFLAQTAMARLVFFAGTTWARIVTTDFTIARLRCDCRCGFALIGLMTQLLHLCQTLSFFTTLLLHR